MAIRFAFAGFRHGHIFDLLEAVRTDESLQIVAACEEDAATRAELSGGGTVSITYDNFDRMLEEVACDVVAIGDYYGRRGSLAIRALRAGKHVISDKPICTRLDELEQIEAICRQKNLAFGCQLDLRNSAALRAARQAVLEGQIGPVHTICVTGQHPLLWGQRPAWYFQPGGQGGTINDIFIHGADAVEWITGRRIVEVVASHAWNARLTQVPFFQDGAQLMLRLDNGGGVLSDVSYLAPEKCGYSSPQYWRFTLHGSDGFIEFDCRNPSIVIATGTDKSPRTIPAREGATRAYFADFLAQVRGQGKDVSLSTAQVLRASRIALRAQQSADEALMHQLV